MVKDRVLFADDAKLYNHIKCIVDAEILQSKNDKFTNWAHRWLVKGMSDERQSRPILLGN